MYFYNQKPKITVTMQIRLKSTEKLSTPEHSFLRAYNKLADAQKLEFEIRAIEMLNYTSTLTFRKRVLGIWPEIHRDVAMKAIEDLFAEYGVPKEEVWGLD